jgi:hypothetical protein
MTSQLSVYRLPFTLRFPFSVIRAQWLMVNGQFMENGKWKVVNGATGGSV